MVQERKSVGVVVFHPGVTGKSLEYLLLHYESGHWDFPKGGVEAGENEEQTLRRELREETGITSAELVPGFKESFSYFFSENGQRVHKTVLFYLGKTSEKQVKLSFEHVGFDWLPYEEAKAKLTYENAKKLLEKADFFLKRK